MDDKDNSDKTSVENTMPDFQAEKSIADDNGVQKIDIIDFSDPQDSEEKVDETIAYKPSDTSSEAIVTPDIVTELSTDPVDSDKTVGNAIDEKKSESDVFESNPDIDAAVDDIVRSESDEAIIETDAKLAALQLAKEKKTFVQKIKGGFRAWWENRPARYGVLAGLAVLFIVVSLLPVTRYSVLNFFGIRVSSSMTVVDSQTRLPLKNINIQLQNQSAATNEDGQVLFTGLKLGKSDLAITKRGYAEDKRVVVLGWGSNPIGDQPLLATGEQFEFVLTDWKSGAIVSDAEATSGENSAKSDENGKIILTVGEENIANVEISIVAKGYREETFNSETLNDSELQVKLVPGKKHAFVSNRNGDYDLYTIDVDAKNEKLLLSATGKEREVPVVIPHPNKDIIAIVSSREGEVNRDGFILDGLYIVDTVSGDNERIARSEQLQTIGWSGDKIIFLQVVEGTSQGNSERSKIISYDYVTREKKDLAASNYFNDVELIGNKLYYAVSSYAVPESQAKLYTVDVDGQNKQKAIDKQVWNIFRTAYDTLLISAVDQKWFKLEGTNPAVEVSQQPAPLALNFVDAPDGKRTVWVEVRDGKGVLLKSTTTEFIEEQVLVVPGLSDVLYWANDSTVVFRVINNQETADYVLNLDGGEMQKITDVTATKNSYF